MKQAMSTTDHSLSDNGVGLLYVMIKKNYKQMKPTFTTITLKNASVRRSGL